LTQKSVMACRSDIDLATLHQHRLEERLHYGFDWCGAHGSSQRQQQQQRLTHYNEQLIHHSVTQQRQRLAKTSGYYKIDHKDPSSDKDEISSKVKENIANNNQRQTQQQAEDVYDFTDTTRRSRSGTWP